MRAIVEAIRGIDPDLRPVKRAVTQAIREQIYHGYERSLAKARGNPHVWSKYEEDRHWSKAAADRVLSGKAERGKRELNRDHVFTAASLVDELLERQRTIIETADLLDLRLVTCTVLAKEHADLGKAPKDLSGWDRYRWAGITVLDRLER